MKKKIAVLLALSIINCRMDILADTDDQGVGRDEAAATPSEAERDTEKNAAEENTAEKNPPEGHSGNPQEASDVADAVYNVLFPAQTHAYLDPGNLSGRGQVFSDEYEVENYGSTDVAIKIKKIEISCGLSEELYEISDTEITDSHSRIKKMNVDMVWKKKDGSDQKVIHVADGSPDEYVIWLKAACYDENGGFVSLDKDSVGYFYFTGTLNSNPNIEWEDGEITVSFSYEIVNTGTEDEPPEKDAQTEGAGGPADEQTGSASNAGRDT